MHRSGDLSREGNDADVILKELILLHVAKINRNIFYQRKLISHGISTFDAKMITGSVIPNLFCRELISVQNNWG